MKVLSGPPLSVSNESYRVLAPTLRSQKTESSCRDESLDGLPDAWGSFEVVIDYSLRSQDSVNAPIIEFRMEFSAAPRDRDCTSEVLLRHFVKTNPAKFWQCFDHMHISQLLQLV